MPIGTVKFFNTAKGFGFITTDGDSKDVFVPASSVTSAGVNNLRPGQRVSFEAMPDTKGPKAVNLTLISNPDPPKIVKEFLRPTPPGGQSSMVLFQTDGCERAQGALSELRASGYDPRVVDYIAAPPARDELRNLSFLLRDSAVGLVRKHDPLFHELRLDDRFISENEFWDAVSEHPSLINGPIVATATKASILRSDNSLMAFLATIDPGRFSAPIDEKVVPKRELKLVGTPAEIVQVLQSAEPGKATSEKAKPPKAAATIKKPGRKAATPAKTVKTLAVPKAKVGSKTKKPIKKAAEKSAAKPRRAAKK
jgi:cold shock CspA family protein/arsenate reductase-like glutaredoxin family protein